jgi:deoxyribodipyrimidine photo-lyase
VLAQVDHAAREVVVGHAGHGDQELVGQIDARGGGHACILFPRHTSGMNKTLDRALVWLRRDLRADDHAALHHALRAARQVWCAFVFDRAILDALPRADRRVEFIRDSLVGVDAELRALAASHGVEGAGLLVRHGVAAEEIPALAARLGVQAVYTSHDDEPYALQRDARVRGALADTGIGLHSAKDHVVFERSEVLTQGGGPFSVFTPYRNAWLKKLAPHYLRPCPLAAHADALAPRPADEAGVPALQALGFEPTNLHTLKLPSGPAGAAELLADFLPRIDRYHETRDFPAVKGRATCPRTCASARCRSAAWRARRTSAWWPARAAPRSGCRS